MTTTANTLRSAPKGMSPPDIDRLDGDEHSLFDYLDGHLTEPAPPPDVSWRALAADLIEMAACWVFVRGADLAAAVRGP